jgi:general secretion pathway protein G
MRIFHSFDFRTPPSPSPHSSCVSREIRASERGLTLIELVLACAMILVLSTAAIPLTRITVKRHREAALRYDLIQMRDAIDRYKDAADKGQIQVAAGTEGYPPDLQTLVHGVPRVGNSQTAGKPLSSSTFMSNSSANANIRFLREIPTDPMTGTKDWGMRSVQDDADATSWGGQDVFDVFTKSAGMALDGSKYSDW